MPKITFARMGDRKTYQVYKNGRYQGRITRYNNRNAVLELIYVPPNPTSHANPHLLACDGLQDAKRKARDLLNPAVGPEAP